MKGSSAGIRNQAYREIAREGKPLPNPQLPAHAAGQCRSMGQIKGEIW
jgi:hypothetical protein